MRNATGLILFFGLFFGLCLPTVGAQRFPYIASIVVAETEVRSGPDSECYATSVLRRGEKVEIYYAHDDWFAIRPPLGSFSWVSGQYVDVNLGNIGTVTVDGLAARIGSENTELCETVQVKLKKGEKLLVLDRKETPENVASPFLYKISPPSGEYRWIPRYAVMPSKSRTSAIVPVRYETEVPDSEPLIPPPPIRSPKKSEDRSKSENPVKRTPTIDEVGTPGEIPSLTEMLANAAPGRQQDTPSSPPAPKELDAFQKAFEELKQESRVALTRPTDDWVFDILIKQGNHLYEIAETDDDLEKLYHLVETLQRTRTVRQEIAMRRQHRSGSALPPPVSPTFGSNFAAVPRIPSLVTTAEHRKETPSYDIVGKLGAFEEPPPKYPPYAVVNERGEITGLITPAPGVDLDRYLGKRVGINGIFELYTKPDEPNKRHITAQSVTEMR